VYVGAGEKYQAVTPIETASTATAGTTTAAIHARDFLRGGAVSTAVGAHAGAAGDGAGAIVAAGAGASAGAGTDGAAGTVAVVVGSAAGGRAGGGGGAADAVVPHGL
jgi:hypothetical protein